MVPAQLGPEGEPNLECNGLINYNAGCGVTEWSRASYGPIFDAQGGGVFAMKWDSEGIAVCEYRGSFPFLIRLKRTAPRVLLSCDGTQRHHQRTP